MRFSYLILFILSFFLVRPAYAQSFAGNQNVVNIVNPIRGLDFWDKKFSLLDTPKAQYKIISEKRLKATWLVRFDALENPDVVTFLKSFDQNQELGLFFEVTPTLAQTSSVKYNESQNWHFAKSVLLIGYSPEDRKKMIDSAFNKYYDVFGVYPKSVGAWWVDANSLSYMREKYQIETNLNVSDQFTTDQYQVWGQYWSLPFYPAKFNALMPAQSEEQKLGVVTIQWATRDPFNGYGDGVFDSTFSVQANDYLLHNLDISYFKKLLDIYPQITIGLENDFDYQKFGREYENQIRVIAERKKQLKTQDYTMQEFAKEYLKINPKISSPQLIIADDPLNSGGKVIWYQTPKYRVGWFYQQGKSLIRDLRIYRDFSKEECFASACNSLNLATSFVNAIDDATFGTRWVIDEGKISDFKVSQKINEVNLSYKNGLGVERKIRFLPNDIEVNNQIKTLDSAILDANQALQKNTSQDSPKMIIYLEWDKILPLQAFNFLKFVILSILFFFIPGWLISRSWIISIPVGLVIFTLVSFISGYLKLDPILWIIPPISIGLLIKSGIPKLPKLRIDVKNLIFITILILGTFTWLLTSIKSGLNYNFGLGFWGPNGHDAIWHLSLISELQKNIPPNNPIFSGGKLANYHYFYDLLIAKSSSLFSLNTLDLFFRFFPILISLFAGVLIFRVTKKIYLNTINQNETHSFIAGISALFFMYFGGSFGWIVSFFRDKTFGGETMFWTQQGISTLLNPPFAISLVIFLTGLYIFYDLKSEDKWSKLQVFSLAILWGSLIEFKAYGGLLVLGALGVFSIEKLLIKRDFKYLIFFLLTLFVSLLVFLPNNSTSSSLVVFSPLWLVRSMIDFPDRLGWYRLSLALQSGVPYKLFLGFLIGIFVFLLGNMGTRLLGLFSLKAFLKNRFMLYIFLLGIILPLNFIQTGTNWNIVQFFYYSLFVLNIFAGFTIAQVYKKFNKSIFLIISIFVILLTLPTTVSTLLEQYIPSRPPAKISSKEVEALNFLKSQPDGVVLTLAHDPKLKEKFSEPLPLFAYAPTAYVSAFSGKTAFLEDTINLEIIGVDYKGRLNLQNDFIRIPDHAKEILKSNNIKYIYTLKPQNFLVDEEKLGITKIYENEETQIYQVK